MVAIVILWVAFFFTHSLLAANSMKERAENFLGKRYIYYRLGYNIFSLVFLLLILYILLFRQEMNFVFHSSSVSSISGIMLMIVGVIITILAFRNYDLAEFSGIKQLAQKIHHPEKLMIKGLNAYVRNPLYFGIIIFIFGYFIHQPTWMNLVSLIIIYAYLYIGTALEEKKLETVFGEEYRQYKKRVKMLIPFLF